MPATRYVPPPPTRYGSLNGPVQMRPEHGPATGAAASRPTVAPPPLAPIKTLPLATTLQTKQTRTPGNALPAAGVVRMTSARRIEPPPPPPVGRMWVQPKLEFPRGIPARGSDIIQLMDLEPQRRSISARNSKSVVVETALGILRANAEDLNIFYERPGGWEGWFQTELYRALIRSQGMTPTSEVHCYSNKALRADFAMIGSDQELAIELKVESFWQVGTFRGQVEKDIIKVHEFGNNGILLIITRATTDDIVSRYTNVKKVGQVGDYVVLSYVPASLFDVGL